MRFLLSLIMLLTFPLKLLAQGSIETTIHDLDMGESLTDEVIVYLGTGKIAGLNPQQYSLLQDLHTAKSDHRLVRLSLDAKNEITAVTLLDEMVAPLSSNKSISEVYTPSVIPSLDEAKTVFRDAKRTSHKESQCYNRAHVWSYEWRVKRNLYSSKTWVYFTRKFIRKFKPQGFEWWFHVAPSVHVMVNGEVKERVMDIKYQSGPSRIQQWTDFFTRGTKAQCPVVTTYSDYANHPNTEWCFIMKSSMYYYQPVDLEFLEKYGTERTMWSEADVRGAYLEAFHMTLPGAI